VNEPTVFVQATSGSQPPCWHSLTSTQPADELPVKPGRHVGPQAKLPGVFVQRWPVGHTVASAHSSTSTHGEARVPAPMKPGGQAQMRPPGVSLQAAISSQPPWFEAHSSTFRQVCAPPHSVIA
jgi:hypothetical protein